MFEFELPDVGEGVAEGELVEWLVAPGDHVAEDEVLAEVETDKAVVDLPSPVAGTIHELHAEEGDMVPVGDVVVTIDPDDDADANVDVTDADVEMTADAESTADAGAEATAEESDESETTAASGGGGRVFAPPNVRRLARELGVDIAAVEGSGPGGRVTEADVRAAGTESGSDDETVESAITDVDGEGDGGRKSAVRKVGSDGEATERKSAVSKVSSSADAAAPDRDRTLAAPATRKLAEDEGIDLDSVPTEKSREGQAYVTPEDVRAYAEAQQAAQEADAAALETSTDEATREVDTGSTAETPTATAAEADVTTEPYRGIRRTIGQQMEQSKYTAPHVSHHDTAVVDELVEMRADLKPRAEEQGVSLTYLPFVMKAVVAGLKEYPILNSSLDEEAEEILVKHYYNVGVAVATEAGLMVPVVENVDEKGMLQIASETAELTERARDRSLAREEMQGGTFTLTNFGAIGGEYATPIINYPETAILGLGSIEQRPVVEESEATESSRGASGGTATGEVVARHTLPLSLSIDHRVIDGAEAARFVNTVIEYLENPSLLLLE